MLYKLTDKFYNSALAKGIYRKKYEPGTIVTEVPGSLGLMLFETYNGAKDFYYFIKCVVDNRKPFIILAVEPMGEITRPEKVCINTSEKSLKFFYDNWDQTMTIRSRYGSVCCSKIKVLYQEGPSFRL